VTALFHIAVSLATVFLIGVVTALYLVALRFPAIEGPRDVFDFASMRRPTTEIDPPGLQRYTARDGEELAYRIYESMAERILIFIHGSSYHGTGYHALAASLSLGGVAKVVLPNLRGHFMSGRNRGDVDYIGQFEDDLLDLVQQLRSRNWNGPISLGGHSSGGGLAIRFAGGEHAKAVTSYLLLAPIIPTSRAIKQGTAGGWANLHVRRLYGLLALNAVGIRGFNALPIVEFNKPPKFWDGTETLTYSYRLNARPARTTATRRKPGTACRSQSRRRTGHRGSRGPRTQLGLAEFASDVHLGVTGRTRVGLAETGFQPCPRARASLRRVTSPFIAPTRSNRRSMEPGNITRRSISSMRSVRKRYLPTT
jgi:hypothetical protein